MKNYLIAAGLIALLAGCSTPATPPDTATHFDPVTGLRTDLIVDNLLESDTQKRELIWLNGSRVYTDNQDFEYYLEVEYRATAETGYLDIRPGNSLVITADDKPMEFSGYGSLNNRMERNGLVLEESIYKATADDLRQIAEAQTVTVKVIGANGIVVREFKEPNFQKFREFVNQYVEGGYQAK